MKQCPYCQRYIGDDSRFCGECGRPLPAACTPPASFEEKAAPSFLPALLVDIGALILLAAYALFFLSSVA
ncbi:MAG: zinc ribbon domain-containing protein [Solobacterium sp.]|nr:zinc ribbon domain-containing protein [Solobacterium sp.]